MTASGSGTIVRPGSAIIPSARAADGYRGGIYISRSYDPYILRHYPYTSSYRFPYYPRYSYYPYYSHHYPYYHNFYHHCRYVYPYHYYYPSYWRRHYPWSISLGLGFPFWSFYWASYPYYYDGWWGSYPYSGGVYVSYPQDTSDTYVYYNTYNNYYSTPPATGETSGDAQARILPSREDEPLAASEREQLLEQIAPLPKAEPAEEGESVLPAGKGLQAGDTEGSAVQTALAGLDAFRSGQYEKAADKLFTATQEDPSSEILKIYLAESLFSIGEYRFSADYLRQALSARKDLALQSFEPSRLYAATSEGKADFESHLALLKEHVRLKPYDTDALLLLGFIQLQSGDLMGAGTSFIALKESAADSSDKEIANQFLEVIHRQSENPSAKPAVPVDDPLLKASAEPDAVGETLIEAMG